MGDFWSGETNWDRNQKKKEAAARAKEEARLKRATQQYSSGASTGFDISGTQEERAKALEGLQLAKTGYGQDIFQTGQDIAGIRERLKERSAQTDPISEAIRGQRSGAVARAQRSLAGAGVKGGAAAGAIEDIARKQDADIAASLYGQQRQSIADERSLASNTLAGTIGLMQGSRAEGVQQPQLPQSGGMFGTVICTELYRQGYMDLVTYSKDAEYGREVLNTCPHVMIGYRFLATPVVKLMQKSKVFTKIISYPAMKWARHIAGEENSIIGYLAINLGQPVCGMIGKLLMKSYGEKYV